MPSDAHVPFCMQTLTCAQLLPHSPRAREFTCGADSNPVHSLGNPLENPDAQCENVTLAEPVNNTPGFSFHGPPRRLRARDAHLSHYGTPMPSPSCVHVPAREQVDRECCGFCILNNAHLMRMWNCTGLRNLVGNTMGIDALARSPHRPFSSLHPPALSIPANVPRTSEAVPRATRVKRCEEHMCV
jgi:hypothetical protein